MADTDESSGETADEKSGGLGKVGWIAVLGLALVFGGGGFFVSWSGMLATADKPAEEYKAPETDVAEVPSFLELDPLMIAVGGAGSVRQLRFRAFLQVDPSKGVETLQPRILDIFATYLRAVSVDRLEDPTGFLTLRAQLLRRVQLLAGPDAVEDLLIIDFVIT